MRMPCQVSTTSPGRSASQRHAERQRADRDEKEDDADHCAAGLLSAASASAAIFRLAASAASRAVACFTQAAAIGFAASGKRGDIAQCGGDVGARGIAIDAGHDRRRIAAGRGVDRRDADQTLRMAFQASEESGLA